MSGAVQAAAARIAPEFAGRLLHDVPLSKHTSWHAGGPADLFFTPRDAMDLSSFIRQLPAELMRQVVIFIAVAHAARGALKP